MLSVKKIQVGKTWRNWADTWNCSPEKILYPASIEEVVSIVKEAAKLGKKIRVVGAGHSFTGLVATNDWIISLDELSGIEEINKEEGIVTALGGTRLFQIGKALAEVGLAQENLGDINVQSIAGAISTGTHGTGLKFSNIPSQVKEITIVTASGNILNISEKENPSYFKAALISLGTLGIIVKVKLKVIEAPIYEYRSEKIKYFQFKKELATFIHNNRHFEFYLFPYSDLVQVKRMNIIDRKPQNLVFHRLESLVLENYLFFLLSEISRLIPKSSPTISKISAWGVGKNRIVGKSHDLFATPRLVKFREMEYSIPLSALKDALRDIRNRIEEKRYNVHFPLEVRTVKADDIWLSPSYQRDSAYIAFHMYKGMPYEDYFRDMEGIMLKSEGRPHWGKMHSLGRKELQKAFPKLEDFLSVRQELDPEGMFLNDYLRQRWLE